jgi:membrane protease YdiL (CAAX protease family)
LAGFGHENRKTTFWNWQKFTTQLIEDDMSKDRAMLECSALSTYNFFLDEKGHLRSGWRVAIFGVAFLICAQVGEAILVGILGALMHRSLVDPDSPLFFAMGYVPILLSATLLGWACGVLFEELPFRALGCLPANGWLKNFGIGSGIGALSLLLAAGIAALARGIHFDLDHAGATAVGETFAVSLLIFLFAAAAEEMLFRGYPLQTLTRAKLAWVGVLLTSVPFAAVHLANPNVVPGFTFLNTALAGVWLASAYLRTRSLWLPFGLHWSWNWAQASLLGLPVSGINRIAPAPLLHAFNAGPDWLTGGTYGIEGGAACTVALLVSTVVIWRTRFLTRQRAE